MIKNKKSILQLLMLVPVCLMISCSDSGKTAYTNVEAPIEDRVNDVLARMTIEEKVSQMRMFHQNLSSKRNLPSTESPFPWHSERRPLPLYPLRTAVC
jgi:hypothetical protein